MQPSKTALSRVRVIDAAIELLDAQGESGLTFRALAARLETGHGAIQWHVANKGELLKAATAACVEHAVGAARPAALPREAVREVALAVFHVMDAHPWVGRQLSSSPWQPTMLWIFELIGRQIQTMSTSHSAQFTATSALLTYIVGAGGREIANAQSTEAAGNRQDLLDTMSEFWASLDPVEYAFTRTITDELRNHDDRAVFLAGIDLILDGIASPAGVSIQAVDGLAPPAVRVNSRGD